MTDALERLGPRLRSLPDGETGDRRNWIIHIIESMRAHPDLELVKDGDWSDYDRIPRFRVVKGHHLYGASLDFGHVASVRESLPVFEVLRAKAGRDDLPFQVGVPGDFDMAVFTLGPKGALRHKRAFTEATLSEIRQVQTLADGDVVFQIEVPAELVFVAGTPGPGQAAMARLLGRRIAALALGSGPRHPLRDPPLPRRHEPPGPGPHGGLDAARPALQRRLQGLAGRPRPRVRPRPLRGGRRPAAHRSRVLQPARPARPPTRESASSPASPTRTRASATSSGSDP